MWVSGERSRHCGNPQSTTEPPACSCRTAAFYNVTSTRHSPLRKKCFKSMLFTSCSSPAKITTSASFRASRLFCRMWMGLSLPSMPRDIPPRKHGMPSSSSALLHCRTTCSVRKASLEEWAQWKQMVPRGRKDIVCHLTSSTGFGGSVAWLPRTMTGFFARLTNSMHLCTWFE